MGDMEGICSISSEVGGRSEDLFFGVLPTGDKIPADSLPQPHPKSRQGILSPTLGRMFTSIPRDFSPTWA